MDLLQQLLDNIVWMIVRNTYQCDQVSTLGQFIVQKTARVKAHSFAHTALLYIVFSQLKHGRQVKQLDFQMRRMRCHVASKTAFSCTYIQDTLVLVKKVAR